MADNSGSIRTGVLRREPSVDFRSARSVGLDGVPYPEVLRLAAAQGRILVSFDENSMPSHFHDFMASGNVSSGVLMAPLGAPTGRVIESILLIWIAYEAEEWIGRIVWLQL